MPSSERPAPHHPLRRSPARSGSWVPTRTRIPKTIRQPSDLSGQESNIRRMDASATSPAQPNRQTALDTLRKLCHDSRRYEAATSRTIAKEITKRLRSAVR